GRPGSFERLEQSLGRVRERCGDAFEIQLNYVVTSHTCTLERFERTKEFCDRFGLHVYVDLVSYSIPFFRKGEKYELHFTDADRERVEAVAGRLLEWKQAEPHRFSQSETFMRSVPDLLLEGEAMKVPCDAYQLLWLGANGDLQLCDVAFPLGNVHEKPLREILFTDAHRRASRDGFKLDCPNCTCKLDSRIRKHAASRLRYRSGVPRATR
ncbi:MAG: SPASM domain-containing protein, partial [Planctomycetota bacterium]